MLYDPNNRTATISPKIDSLIKLYDALCNKIDTYLSEFKTPRSLKTHLEECIYDNIPIGLGQLSIALDEIQNSSLDKTIFYDEFNSARELANQGLQRLIAIPGFWLTTYNQKTNHNLTREQLKLPIKIENIIADIIDQFNQISNIRKHEEIQQHSYVTSSESNETLKRRDAA